MEILSIIPARGGSKGLCRKNVKLLNGKPLISYTIEASKLSQFITRTIVTTEEPQIAGIAREWGAEVPFLRPVELASDHSKSIDVALHALGWLKENEEYLPDVVIFMQPTSPLRNNLHIDEALQQFKRSNARAVISVCETEHSPYWTNKIEDERLQPLLHLPLANPRRQDLPKTYRYNGAIYITSTGNLLEQETFFGDVEPYIMTREDSIDIDTLMDFKLAEIMLDFNSHSLKM